MRIRLILAILLIATNAQAFGFGDGFFTFGTSGVMRRVNTIGVQGGVGFGVGICPGAKLPAGFTPLPGYNNPQSDNYGNYRYSDNSIMVWIPKFYYRIGSASNPTFAAYGVNSVDIKGTETFTSTASANAAGYALHRMFMDGGIEQDGVFVDKYKCSNNAGTASSIAFGLPLSSNSVHNPFSGLTGAPANFYYGAITAAKTRGANFFCSSRFIFAGLALLSQAHGQAAKSATWCAWYDAAGVTNFPKGCNNNALKDTNDPSLTFVSDGYSNACKTGSASVLAKTTHNGQPCGVVDLNGGMWEITPGLATDTAAAAYYVLKTSAAMKNVTGGATVATDLWGAAGLAALYDSLGATYGAATASGTIKLYGAAGQVLSAATSGLPWQATGLGLPLVGGVGGTNLFGSDGLLDYRPASMCPLSGGGWADTSNAGVWAFHLGHVRGDSSGDVGFRSALYL